MPARLLTAAPLGATTLAALLTGCGGGDVKQTVDVTVTASNCTLASTSVTAGLTAFDVANDSGKEAEAYVYTTDGKVVDEVEHIADGTSRTLKVDLDAGSYEFACKPEGDDNRTDFTVK
jgi:iron uptake system component EfeO